MCNFYEQYLLHTLNITDRSSFILWHVLFCLYCLRSLVFTLLSPVTFTCFDLRSLFALQISLAFWTHKRFQLALYLLALSPQALTAKGIASSFIA